MLQQIRIDNWLVEVDLDQTREFYNKDLVVCDCLYCKNYVEATKSFNNSISDLFSQLGILASKPAELSYFSTDESGEMCYIGDFHLVGKVLEGELCTPSNFEETNTFKVENFTFGFSEHLEFVPKRFPTPVLQFILVANIPWVLEENPED